MLLMHLSFLLLLFCLLLFGCRGRHCPIRFLINCLHCIVVVVVDVVVNEFVSNLVRKTFIVVTATSLNLRSSKIVRKRAQGNDTEEREGLFLFNFS